MRHAWVMSLHIVGDPAADAVLDEHGTPSSGPSTGEAAGRGRRGFNAVNVRDVVVVGMKNPWPPQVREVRLRGHHSQLSRQQHQTHVDSPHSSWRRARSAWRRELDACFEEMGDQTRLRTSWTDSQRAALRAPCLRTPRPSGSLLTHVPPSLMIGATSCRRWTPKVRRAWSDGTDQRGPCLRAPQRVGGCASFSVLSEFSRHLGAVQSHGPTNDLGYSG